MIWTRNTPTAARGITTTQATLCGSFRRIEDAMFCQRSPHWMTHQEAVITIGSLALTTVLAGGRFPLPFAQVTRYHNHRGHQHHRGQQHRHPARSTSRKSVRTTTHHTNNYLADEPSSKGVAEGTPPHGLQGPWRKTANGHALAPRAGASLPTPTL